MLAIDLFYSLLWLNRICFCLTVRGGLTRLLLEPQPVQSVRLGDGHKAELFLYWENGWNAVIWILSAFVLLRRGEGWCKCVLFFMLRDAGFHISVMEWVGRGVVRKLQAANTLLSTEKKTCLKINSFQTFTGFRICRQHWIFGVGSLFHLLCSPPSEPERCSLVCSSSSSSFSHIVPIWLVCLPLSTQPSRNVAVPDGWRSVSAQGLHVSAWLCAHVAMWLSAAGPGVKWLKKICNGHGGTFDSHHFLVIFLWMFWRFLRM